MFCSDSITEIDGSETGLVVERHSRLELTCRVTSGDRTPAFIIWQKENKVSRTFTVLSYQVCLSEADVVVYILNVSPFSHIVSPDQD